MLSGFARLDGHVHLDQHFAAGSNTRTGGGELLPRYSPCDEIEKTADTDAGGDKTPGESVSIISSNDKCCIGGWRDDASPPAGRANKWNDRIEASEEPVTMVPINLDPGTRGISIGTGDGSNVIEAIPRVCALMLVNSWPVWIDQIRMDRSPEAEILLTHQLVVNTDKGGKRTWTLK
jgi:hypothetical protein